MRVARLKHRLASCTSFPWTRLAHLLRPDSRQIALCLLFGSWLLAPARAQAQTAVYYSVGTSFPGDLKSGTPTISITAGTATFSLPQPNNIGVGDDITYNGTTHAYISGRTSSTVYSVTTATGTAPPNVAGATVDSISRAFGTLSSAEANSSNAAHLNSANLVTGGFQLHWAMYNDGPLNDGGIQVDGYTTGPANYIRIFTPLSPTQVGSRQRHLGRAGTGFRLRPINAAPPSSYQVLYIRDEHVRVEGIEIDGSQVVTTQFFTGIRTDPTLSPAADVRIDGVIIHDVTIASTALERDVMGIQVQQGVARVSNSIIYDLHNSSSNTSANTHAIRLEGATTGAYVHNNTVYDIKNLGTAGSTEALSTINSASFLALKNTVVLDVTENGAPAPCFAGTITNPSNNVSSDATAPGPGSQINKTTYASYFVSITPGSEDLHIRNNTNVLWGSSGADLDADPSLPVVVDVDRQARHPNLPDIGADEYGDSCCALSVTESASTISVEGLDSFRMRFNTATGGGMDQFHDLVEDPGAVRDLAAGVGAAAQQSLVSDEVEFFHTDFEPTADTLPGRVDLLEFTPTRVRVRQESLYQRDFGPFILAGLKGIGDYSLYGSGRLAVRWNKKATQNVPYTFQQRQLTVRYQGAAPLDAWTGFSRDFGPVASPFGGANGGAASANDDFVLAQIEQPGARTDFLGILHQSWAAANDTFFGDIAAQEWEEVSWRDTDAGTILAGAGPYSVQAGETWNLLTYFKPTNFVDRSDPAVTSRANDYRSLAMPYNVTAGSQWQDASENTAAGGDFFNESEGAYVFNLNPATGLTFDLDGSGAAPRYKPFLKVRQWRSFGAPASMTLEGATLRRNQGYSADVKPVTRAHFAQDVTYHATLESALIFTSSPQAGDPAGSTIAGGVTFPAARYGNGAQFTSDGQYLTIPSAGNFDPAQGAIEFWYKPFYDYSAGVPDPHDHALFGYWIDANNYFYAYFDPYPTDLEGADDGLTFAVSTTAGGLAKVVTGAGPGFTEYWRANEWVHLRFVWKADPASSRLEIYINGKLAPPSAMSIGAYTTAVGTEAAFAIGDRGRFDLFDNHANGIIDEFHIYSSPDAPAPLAHGGLTTDSTEYLADNARNFTLAFDPLGAFLRGEYFYIGADAKFRGLNIGLVTAGAGPAADAILWEYWDGVRWSSLELQPGFTDQTASFTKPAGSVFWDVEPASWSPYSLRGGPDLYYVRASLTGAVDYAPTPVEAGIRTDILLFQYCGDVTALAQTFSFGPPIATAVTLSSFTATSLDGAVDLSWTTASELQNLGFDLYRAESADGPYLRITSSLIPGLGSSPTGRSYSYRDAGLLNGRTYFYKLEDVETTGRTEMHGPVSATPSASAAEGGGSPDPSDRPAPWGTSYGDPSSVVLREVERSRRHVVLELLTGGFLATPVENGQARVTIPGFESVSRPGQPELPMRRALVEAVAGRKVHLASVVAQDVLQFPDLRPSTQGSPEIEVSEEGVVLPSRQRRREGGAFREVFPSDWARLQGTSFQEETKKAEVLLFPLRWDGRGLALSRRLRVRLEFSGIEAGETSRGGNRGRRVVKRGSHARSGVMAQLAVKERGLYRVGFEELFPTPAGRRSRGILASSLRLSRQGESVAFHVEPSGTLGPGSSLYFLSEGSSLNSYADAVYELETNVAGVQMEVETLSSLSTVVLEHFALVEREENKYYQSGLLEAPDLWLWDLVVSPGTKGFPFTVEQLSSSSSAARLSVALQGASDFEGIVDHHVKVRVNGSLVGEASWDGKLSQTVEAEVPAGVLREGENTLEIEDAGDTGVSYSLVFLNRFSVSYPRRLVATEGRLEGRFEMSGQAEVAGGSTSSVLLDTTATPRWLRGLRDAASGVSFPVLAGRSYLLASSFLSPEVRLLEPSTLKSETNQADYLLLAPMAFLEAAQPLLELRQSQGLTTKAVSLEEVFAQFGHGETSPLAIKEFLEYAYQFWADPSPRYVLLLGDASYDPKNYLQTGVKDWLPGFPMKTSFLWTVSDPAYAAVNGEDLLPDLALGRLSAGSVEEAQRLIQKVLAFENGGGNFDGAAVLVADNADIAGNFEQDANEIAQTLLAARAPRKIYYSQLGSGTRASIIDAFDQGASLVSYVGHGGTVIWASENIFNNKDVANLAPQPQQPLLLTLNCLNGFFHFPPLNSLSEAFVKAEGKGAIAAFSPSGLSVNDAAHLFHKALLQEILSGRHERLGDAVLAAQKAYADSGAFPELLSIYNLFGDPALQLK